MLRAAFELLGREDRARRPPGRCARPRRRRPSRGRSGRSPPRTAGRRSASTSRLPGTMSSSGTKRMSWFSGLPQLASAALVPVIGGELDEGAAVHHVRNDTSGSRPAPCFSLWQFTQKPMVRSTLRWATVCSRDVAVARRALDLGADVRRVVELHVRLRAGSRRRAARRGRGPSPASPVICWMRGRSVAIASWQIMQVLTLGRPPRGPSSRSRGSTRCRRSPCSTCMLCGNSIGCSGSGRRREEVVQRRAEGRMRGREDAGALARQHGAGRRGGGWVARSAGSRRRQPTRARRLTSAAKKEQRSHRPHAALSAAAFLGPRLRR